MLNEADIEWIKGNRSEITGNRQTLITIAYESEGTVDEISGETTGGETVERDVMSVVTEITTLAEAGIERLIDGGLAVEKGDIWLSINYDKVSDIVREIVNIRYDDVWYAILALDKKGIGEPNRIEVLGRVIS